jgi:hypothetical protein
VPVGLSICVVCGARKELVQVFRTPPPSSLEPPPKLQGFKWLLKWRFASYLRFLRQCEEVRSSASQSGTSKEGRLQSFQKSAQLFGDFE